MRIPPEPVLDERLQCIHRRRFTVDEAQPTRAPGERPSQRRISPRSACADIESIFGNPRDNRDRLTVNSDLRAHHRPIDARVSPRPDVRRTRRCSSCPAGPPPCGAESRPPVAIPLPRSRWRCASMRSAPSIAAATRPSGSARCRTPTRPSARTHVRIELGDPGGVVPNASTAIGLSTYTGITGMRRSCSSRRTQYKQLLDAADGNAE